MGRVNTERTASCMHPRRSSIPTSAQTTVRVERLEVRWGRTSLGDNLAESISTDSGVFFCVLSSVSWDTPVPAETRQSINQLAKNPVERGVIRGSRSLMHT